MPRTKRTFTFPPARRIRASEDFLKALGGTKKISGVGFNLRFLEGSQLRPRLGLVLSKKKLFQRSPAMR